jgi:pyridoxine/pyridoxamine 5'-phosphate oxidase
VERVPAAEADAYFASRPRGSQLGALVSDQSAVVPGGRPELQRRAEEVAVAHTDEAAPVPRPAHWGGFLLRPTAVEFWQVGA